MRRAQRLGAALRRRQSLGQCIQRLVDIIHLHALPRLAANGLLKRLVQLRTDDKHHPLKARAARIIQRIIQNDLSVRPDRVDLFQPAIARTHPRGHNHQNRLCHSAFLLFHGSTATDYYSVAYSPKNG